MKKALYVVLGLSLLVDLALGAWASVSWGSFCGTWHLSFTALQSDAYKDTQLLGFVLGFCLFCFTALQALAIYWIRTEKEQGYQLSVLFGCYLLVSSVFTFAIFHRTDFLLLDGIRGALVAVLATVSLNAPATVRELRLPNGAQRAGGRRRDERATGSSHSRGQAGGSGGRDRRSARPSRAQILLEQQQARGTGRRRGAWADRERGGHTEQADRIERLPRHERTDSRDRSGGRDRWASRDRVRQPASGAATPAPPAAEPEAFSEANRRERGDEGDLRDRGHRGEDRLRSPQDLTGRPAAGQRRPRSGDSDEELPLTVVVRGAPELLRPRLSEEETTPATPEPARGEEVEFAATDADRHRRRRRRRPRGGRGQEEEGAPASGESAIGFREERSSPDEPIASRPEAEEERPTPVRERSSGYVEALDMLSMLEPSSRRAGGAAEPFGRTRRPVTRRKGPATNATPGPAPNATAGPGPMIWPSDPVRENDNEGPDRPPEE